MIIINQNLNNLKPSSTLAINQKVKELRDLKLEIYNFGFGQSPFPVHESIVKGLVKHAGNNKYLPSQGLETLRSEIAKYLFKYQNISTSSEQIYIGPGSKELLYQTILILEGTFLIPKGSWVSYGPQINSKGVDYVILDTAFENNYKLSPATLEAYCKSNPKDQKTLILNSPNNPSGAVYTYDELQLLAKVCNLYNLIVISDEIYSQINFNFTLSPSISRFYPERTIVFGGISKVFSAGGYRLGFMVLPKSFQYLQNTFLSLFSETFSAVSSPIQYAAIEAFKMESSLKLYINNSLMILKTVSDFIYTELTNCEIKCTKPQGAFYIMIDFDKYSNKIMALGIQNSTTLSIYLLENYKVAILPGSDFYFNEHEFIFRLAFVDFNGEKVIEAYENSKITEEQFVKINCPNIFRGVQQLKSFVRQL